MANDFRRMRSQIQHQLWSDPSYRVHMCLVHTGKRYPTASLKKRGRTPWNRFGRTQNCVQCGTPFWVPPGRFRTANYCSRRCTRLANDRFLTSRSCRARAAMKRWSDPVHHQRLAQTMRNRWRHMSPIERQQRLANMHKSNFGKHVSSVTRDRIRKARLQQVFPTKDTMIERTMQQELSKRGIRFAKHFPILNRCQADIAFPDHRLAVFCDGDYWHNRLDTRTKDITQEMILRANGWRVLRFWEHEINANPAACADCVVKELAA